MLSSELSTTFVDKQFFTKLAVSDIVQFAFDFIKRQVIEAEVKD